MSWISSRGIPHFWIRSNLRISRRSFVRRTSARPSRPFFLPMADFPVRTSCSEKSEQRGTAIAGRSSRALRTMTMSMSITRFTVLELLSQQPNEGQSSGRSNSIDLWKGGNEEAHSVARAFLLAFLAILPNIRVSPCLYLCTKNTRAIRHAEGELVTRRLLTSVPEGRKRAMKGAWRFAFVDSSWQLFSNWPLQGDWGERFVCVGFVFAPAHELVFAYIRHHND